MIAHAPAFASSIDLGELRCGKHVEIDKAYRSIGSLGGGNHFIEIDKDTRNYNAGRPFRKPLGLEVAEWYQDAAWKLRKCVSENTELPRKALACAKGG